RPGSRRPAGRSRRCARRRRPSMKCERCGSSEAFLDTEWGSRCGKSPALSPGKLRHDADWRSSGERIHGLEGIAEIALVRTALERRLPAPYVHLDVEGLRVARDALRDLAEADEPEAFPRDGTSEVALPFPRARRFDLGDEFTQRREDQRPGELGRGDRRAAAV